MLRRMRGSLSKVVAFDFFEGRVEDGVVADGLGAASVGDSPVVERLRGFGVAGVGDEGEEEAYAGAQEKSICKDSFAALLVHDFTLGMSRTFGTMTAGMLARR